MLKKLNKESLPVYGCMFGAGVVVGVCGKAVYKKVKRIIKEKHQDKETVINDAKDFGMDFAAGIISEEEFNEKMNDKETSKLFKETAEAAYKEERKKIRAEKIAKKRAEREAGYQAYKEAAMKAGEEIKDVFVETPTESEEACKEQVQEDHKETSKVIFEKEDEKDDTPRQERPPKWADPYDEDFEESDWEEDPENKDLIEEEEYDENTTFTDEAGNEFNIYGEKIYEKESQPKIQDPERYREESLAFVRSTPGKKAFCYFISEHQYDYECEHYDKLEWCWFYEDNTLVDEAMNVMNWTDPTGGGLKSKQVEYQWVKYIFNQQLLDVLNMDEEEPFNDLAYEINGEKSDPNEIIVRCDKEKADVRIVRRQGHYWKG